MTRAPLLAAAWVLVGCATVPPETGSTPPVAGPVFSHADLDELLAMYVDDRGRVDYEGLRRDRTRLDRVLVANAETSPDSHPERFPTPDHVLAYWLNAYNAAAIGFVIDAYPIASVREVRPLWGLRVPAGAGFFLKRAALGGRTASLYGLENVVIRRRFPDPRIHFALNCASIGCPRLPRTAFDGARLEQQLRDETRRFLAERRNLEVDLDAQVVTLSSIFSWYEQDFVDHAIAKHPSHAPTLLGYVEATLAELGSPGAETLARCRDCRVAFRPYDWGLNDQRSAP